MNPTIRPARLDDAEAIAAFTMGTFTWGDYVGDQFPTWLDESATEVAVATDEDDRPIALARVKMLGPREGWLSAARVNPDHRRRGLGSALNDWCVDWVASQGGVVCRLQIETVNEAAHNQVLQLGYRPVISVLNAARSTNPASDSNGAGHTPVPERLTKAPKAEADLAYIAWSTSEVGRRARGMFAAETWSWRRLREDDVAAGPLLASPSGWAIAESLEGELTVRWITCGPEDVDRLLRAIIDLARDRKDDTIQVIVPDVEWMATALLRLGFITDHASRIYEKPVPIR